MTTTEPLAFGIDYAWAQIPAPAIKRAGAKFVARYLAGSARLTPQERDNLHAQDIAILLTVEQEADAAEKGYQRGRQLAQIGNDEANSLGYPESCLLLYTDDHNDPNPDEEVNFMHGVKDAGGRTSDLYSGGNVLVAISNSSLSPFGGWAVETWFPHAGADPFMTQLANTRDPIHIDGIPDDQFDTNVLHRAVPMWGPNGVTYLGPVTEAASIDTTEEVNDMIFVDNDGKAGCYWRHGGQLLFRAFNQGTPDAIVVVSEDCDPTNMAVRESGPFVFTPSNDGRLVRVTPTAVGPHAEVV